MFAVTLISFLFQSTLPVWGATAKALVRYLHDVISIHAPRVGSDLRLRDFVWYFRISIHAPRVGSDGFLNSLPMIIDISIHAPRVGSDEGDHKWTSESYFNPRSPCGERPAFSASVSASIAISIHAPRVGSDFDVDDPVQRSCADFNPRSPCGERPDHVIRRDRRIMISIHAPRVGSDGVIWVFLC